MEQGNEKFFGFFSNVILGLAVILILITGNVPHTQAKENLSPLLLNHWISTLFKKSNTRERRELTEEQFPQVYRKCATSLMRLAREHADWLSPENRSVLYRPDRSSYISSYAPDAETYWTQDTPEGHFKIHYNENGAHAVYGSDGIQDTIPDYVVSFGSYFEQSWDYQVNRLGYIHPPSDGTKGGDSRFDVYILDISSYGYTDLDGGYAYIAVNNRYDDFPPNLDPEGSRAGAMKVTAAHEFFHAIQFEYDDWNYDSLWWEENTAVWMEDKVFDAVNDYLNYLGNPFDDLNDNRAWDNGEPWYEHDGSLGGRKINTSSRRSRLFILWFSCSAFQRRW